MKRKSIFFLAKFMVIFAVLHLLIYFIDISFLQQAIAAFEANLLGLNYSGTGIAVGGSLFDISKSCTGLIASFILAAVVFALKKPGWKEKAAIYALGTTALLLINLLRVYLVLLGALAFGVSFAEMLHTASWFAMSALIVVLWYYSVTRIYKIKSFEGFL